jgi:hypothetical protein
MYTRVGLHCAIFEFTKFTPRAQSLLHIVSHYVHYEEILLITAHRVAFFLSFRQF